MTNVLIRTNCLRHPEPKFTAALAPPARVPALVAAYSLCSSMLLAVNKLAVTAGGPRAVVHLAVQACVVRGRHSRVVRLQLGSVRSPRAGQGQKVSAHRCRRVLEIQHFKDPVPCDCSQPTLKNARCSAVEPPTTPAPLSGYDALWRARLPVAWRWHTRLRPSQGSRTPSASAATAGKRIAPDSSPAQSKRPRPARLGRLVCVHCCATTARPGRKMA